MIPAQRGEDIGLVSTIDRVAVSESVAPAAAPPPGRLSSWPRVGAAVLLLTAILSVMLIAFALPAARSRLSAVPLAVAGPAPAADRVVAALAHQRPGAFVITRVPDTAAAEEAIRAHTVYGAIDVSGARPRVLTASAASPPIAQALGQLALALGSGPNVTAAGAGGEPAGGAVEVRDLVPAPAGDPRGAGLAASALPLVLAGVLAATLLANLIAGAYRRLIGALAFAATAGLAMAGILQYLLGSIQGIYLANATVIGFGTAAIALTLLGLWSLLGKAGLVLGAITMVLLGNPLSGLSSAPEMLPAGWGKLGPLLPPGAEGSLLRDTAFFGGHHAGGHVVILLAWTAGGLLLSLVGAGVYVRAGRVRAEPVRARRAGRSLR